MELRSTFPEEQPASSPTKRKHGWYTAQTQAKQQDQAYRWQVAPLVLHMHGHKSTERATVNNAEEAALGECLHHESRTRSKPGTWPSNVRVRTSATDGGEMHGLRKVHHVQQPTARVETRDWHIRIIAECSVPQPYLLTSPDGSISALHGSRSEVIFTG